jgi:O-antigen/teichoic acid export membrane protein
VTLPSGQDEDGLHAPPLAARASRGALWIAAGTWMQRGVAVVVLLVLARYLNPRELGVLSLATLLSFLFLAITELGYLNALIYQRRRVHEAAETTLAVTVLLTPACCFFLLLGAPWITSFFGTSEATTVLRIYAVFLPFSALAQVVEAELTRRLAFSRRFVATVPSVIGGAITVILAVQGFGIWSLVVGDAFRETFRCVLAFLVLPERFRPRWHGDLAREMWVFARGSFAGTWLDNALQNADYLLVVKLLGPTALGLYTLAFRVAILPFVVVTQVVVGVMFPALVQVSDDRDRLNDGFEISFRLGTAAVVLFGGGVTALAPHLAILGDDWRAAAATAQLLGVYVCLRSAAFMATPVVQALGRPGAVAVLRGIWTLLLVALIATVGRRGIAIVGLVQVVVAALLFLAHAVLVSRVGGTSTIRLVLWLARPGLAAVLATLALWVLRRTGGVWTDYRSVYALLLSGFVFTLVYVASELVLSPLLSDLRRLRQSLLADKA